METEIIAAAAPKPSLLAKIAGLTVRTKIIAAASIVAVVGGGSTFAYAALQDPNTVVGLALANALGGSHPSGIIGFDVTSSTINAQGSLNFRSADVGSSAELNVASQVGGAPLGATLNVVSSKAGDYYLNLDNFDSLASYLLSAGQIDPVTESSYAKALKGTWIKVTTKDLTGGASITSCQGQASLPSLLKAQSENLKSELGQNSFIVVTKELPGENGDRVFQLGFDAKKMNAFYTAFGKGKNFAQIRKCLPGFNGFASSAFTHITQAQLDAAVKAIGLDMKVYAKGGWSPNLDKLVVSASQSQTGSATITFTPTGDQSSKVVIPSKSVPYQQFLVSLLQP